MIGGSTERRGLAIATLRSTRVTRTPCGLRFQETSKRTRRPHHSCGDRRWRPAPDSLSPSCAENTGAVKLPETKKRKEFTPVARYDPSLFQRPYHAQTMTEGNAGHQSVNRFQIVDSVPFQTSFNCIWMGRSWVIRWTCIIPRSFVRNPSRSIAVPCQPASTRSRSRFLAQRISQEILYVRFGQIVAEGCPLAVLQASSANLNEHARRRQDWTQGNLRRCAE